MAAGTLGSLSLGQRSPLVSIVACSRRFSGGRVVVSGRGAAPAAGTFSEEKSGVSPGRNGGSGTCNARLRRVAAKDGSLSLMVGASA